MKEKRWSVDIVIDEHEGRTRAEARLQAEAATLKGTGLARLNPNDPDVPEIGDELAVCRALSGLVHDLFEATIADIQWNDPESEGPDVHLD